MKYGMVIFTFVAVAVIPAAADIGTSAAPDGHPLIPAICASSPPVLDGRLDDPVWLAAARLDDFYSPHLARTPPESTVVWLARDSAFLYIAARCYDREPTLIRREQTRRGGSFGGDDYLAVCIDANHEHRSGGAWEFKITAGGTQDENIPAGAASKVEWRGDWTAAAQADSLGWTTELAVPLAIFNQPAGERTIGVAIWRRIGRTGELLRWPNTGTTIDEAKDGDWTGVRFPHYRRRPAATATAPSASTRSSPSAAASSSLARSTPTSGTSSGRSSASTTRIRRRRSARTGRSSSTGTATCRRARRSTRGASARCTAGSSSTAPRARTGSASSRRTTGTRSTT